jgi:hypothetical protein
MHIQIDTKSYGLPLWRRTLLIEDATARDIGYGGLAYGSDWLDPEAHKSRRLGWLFSLTHIPGQWQAIVFGLLFIVTYSSPGLPGTAQKPVSAPKTSGLLPDQLRFTYQVAHGQVRLSSQHAHIFNDIERTTASWPSPFDAPHHVPTVH